MRPARRVDDSGSADVIVGPVTVTLQDALEVTQESFGPFSLTTHSKVENHRRASNDLLFPRQIRW
jgi:hypothetical protein